MKKLTKAQAGKIIKGTTAIKNWLKGATKIAANQKEASKIKLSPNTVSSIKKEVKWPSNTGPSIKKEVKYPKNAEWVSSRKEPKRPVGWSVTVPKVPGKKTGGSIKSKKR